MKPNQNKNPESATIKTINALWISLTCGIIGYTIGQAVEISRNPGQTQKSSDTAIANVQPHIGTTSSENIASKSTNGPGSETRNPSPSISAAQRAQDTSKRMESRHHQNVHNKDVAEYVPFFDALGISKEPVQSLMAMLFEFHEPISRINLATQDLAAKRDAYHKAVKNLLTPEQLERYKAFENRRPAIREADAVEDFMGRHNTVLTANIKSTIADAIQKNNAITIFTIHGPYDPMPVFETGQDAIRKLERQLASTQSTMPGVIDDLKGSISDADLALVKQYYEHKVAEFQESLALVSRTEEQIMEEMMARFRKGSPNQPPNPPKQ